MQEAVYAVFVSLLINKTCLHSFCGGHAPLRTTQGCSAPKPFPVPDSPEHLHSVATSLQSLPCSPFSLCLLHLLLFLPNGLYQNIAFFSFKIPSPASCILGGKTPQCGNSKSILIVHLSLQWRSSGISVSWKRIHRVEKIRGWDFPQLF